LYYSQHSISVPHALICGASREAPGYLSLG
jgi:hypothetical protein